MDSPSAIPSPGDMPVGGNVPISETFNGSVYAERSECNARAACTELNRRLSAASRIAPPARWPLGAASRKPTDGRYPRPRDRGLSIACREIFSRNGFLTSEPEPCQERCLPEAAPHGGTRLLLSHLCEAPMRAMEAGGVAWLRGMVRERTPKTP